MSSYKEVAIAAAKYLEQGINPKDSWHKASCEIFGEGSSSQLKGCPKNTFLGLCYLNAIKGYTHNEEFKLTKNAEYAIKAVELIKEENISNPKELWARVMGDEQKAYNQQMHVVLALFENGYIV